MQGLQSVSVAGYNEFMVHLPLGSSSIFPRSATNSPPFLPFSSPQRTTASRKEQPPQEEASGNRKAVVPDLGSSADLPTPPRARETVRARTVAARTATGVIWE